MGEAAVLLSFPTMAQFLLMEDEELFQTTLGPRGNFVIEARNGGKGPKLLPGAREVLVSANNEVLPIGRTLARPTLGSGATPA